MGFGDDKFRQDMRRLRIQPLLNEVLQIVSQHLTDEDERRNAMRRIHDELFNKLHEHGVELLTDHMRADLGLSPRDQDGWTAEEIRALEMRRLEVLSKPLVFTVPTDLCTANKPT